MTKDEKLRAWIKENTDELKIVNDFENTWCKASTETNIELNKLFPCRENLPHNSTDKMYCIINNTLLYRSYPFEPEDNMREIHFVNGRFEYVPGTSKDEELIAWINEHESAEIECEIYKKDMFAKYGFEVPDFKENIMNRDEALVRLHCRIYCMFNYEDIRKDDDFKDMIKETMSFALLRLSVSFLGLAKTVWRGLSCTK